MNTESLPSKRRRSQRPEGNTWRTTVYDIIFEADTPSGWWFDILLLVAILASVAIISLETVPEYGKNPKLTHWFWYAEIFLTALFTVEYVLRLCCVRSPLRYAFSFWGIIDLLSILPTFVAAFAASGSAKSFVMLRSVRLLRAFRVLKLWRMMKDADELSDAIWGARNKIIVFLAVVMVAITISGTLMYYIENEVPRLLHESKYADVPITEREESPPTTTFTSIPTSMYWATVTMTTVGYGDITPKTPVGKVISAALILLGYSLIIVPSGFVSAELKSQSAKESELPCTRCEAASHRNDATYCYRCGEKLD